MNLVQCSEQRVWPQGLSFVNKVRTNITTNREELVIYEDEAGGLYYIDEDGNEIDCDEEGNPLDGDEDDD